MLKRCNSMQRNKIKKFQSKKLFLSFVFRWSLRECVNINKLMISACMQRWRERKVIFFGSSLKINKQKDRFSTVNLVSHKIKRKIHINIYIIYTDIYIIYIFKFLEVKEYWNYLLFFFLFAFFAFQICVGLPAEQFFFFISLVLVMKTCGVVEIVFYSR